MRALLAENVGGPALLGFEIQGGVVLAQDGDGRLAEPVEVVGRERPCGSLPGVGLGGDEPDVTDTSDGRVGVICPLRERAGELTVGLPGYGLDRLAVAGDVVRPRAKQRRERDVARVLWASPLRRQGIGVDSERAPKGLEASAAERGERRGPVWWEACRSQGVGDPCAPEAG